MCSKGALSLPHSVASQYRHPLTGPWESALGTPDRLMLSRSCFISCFPSLPLRPHTLHPPPAWLGLLQGQGPGRGHCQRGALPARSTPEAKLGSSSSWLLVHRKVSTNGVAGGPSAFPGAQVRAPCIPGVVHPPRCLKVTEGTFRAGAMCPHCPLQCSCHGDLKHHKMLN